MFQYDQEVLKQEHKILLQKNQNGGSTTNFKSLDPQITNMILKLDQI